MQSLRDMNQPANLSKLLGHEMDPLLTVIPTNEMMNWDMFELPAGRGVFPWPSMPRQSLVRRRVGRTKSLRESAAKNSHFQALDNNRAGTQES